MSISRRSLFAAGSALAAFFLPNKAKSKTLDERFAQKEEKPERRLERLERNDPVTCSKVYDLVVTFAPSDLKAGDVVFQVCSDGTKKPIGAALMAADKGDPVFVAAGMFFK